MRQTIATKLFRGFLIIICLNVSFVFIVRQLSSLNSTASILKEQSEIKNELLQFKNIHNLQKNLRFIFFSIGKKANADKFLKNGEKSSKMLNQALSDLTDILNLDTTASGSEVNDSGIVYLYETVKNDISVNNTFYIQAFLELSKIKKGKKFKEKREQLNKYLDTAEINIARGLDIADSIIEAQNMTRVKEIETRIDKVNDLTRLILILMSFFSILFALLFSRYISKHLRRLKESTSTIAKGDFNFNPKGYPNDEIGDLANAFFDMAYDLRKTQNELIKKRRLAAIGEIVASVNHEINNPLMIISGNAQFLEMTLEKAASKDTKERIRAILEETERISLVTRKLRDIKNPVVEDYTSSGEQMINLDKSSKNSNE